MKPQVAHLIHLITRLALRAFGDVHFAAQRDRRNDEEKREESYARLLDEMILVAARAAAHEFGGPIRAPEKHLCSDN